MSRKYIISLLLSLSDERALFISQYACIYVLLVLSFVFSPADKSVSLLVQTSVSINYCIT